MRASPDTAAAYARNLEALARDAFAGHELRESAPGRWRIQRRESDGRWSVFYAAEIVVLWGGKLLVHGDVAPVIFAGGDSGDVTATLHWIAESSVDYLTPKATVGMGTSMETVDTDVAAGELLQRAADRIEENVCDWPCDALGLEVDPDAPAFARDTAVFTFLWFVARLHAELGGADRAVQRWAAAATKLLRGDRLDDVREQLIHGGEDPESLYELGDVPDPRVFYARGAVQRLRALLDSARPSEATGAP